MTTTSIKIQWLDDVEDAEDYYILYIWPTGMERPNQLSQFIPTDLDKTTAEATFNNLTPGILYNIEIIEGTQDIDTRSTVQRTRK